MEAGDASIDSPYVIALSLNHGYGKYLRDRWSKADSVRNEITGDMDRLDHWVSVSRT